MVCRAGDIHQRVTLKLLNGTGMAAARTSGLDLGLSGRGAGQLLTTTDDVR